METTKTMTQKHGTCMKFYGVDELTVIDHGEWSDPEVQYGCVRINYHELEDWFYQDCRDLLGREPDDREFYEYMRSRKREILDRAKDLVNETLGTRSLYTVVYTKIDNEFSLTTETLAIYMDFDNAYNRMDNEFSKLINSYPDNDLNNGLDFGYEIEPRTMGRPSRAHAFIKASSGDSHVFHAWEVSEIEGIRDYWNIFPE